jgi:16S rRNA (cytosine1402-N4)-methyltransferase
MVQPAHIPVLLEEAIRELRVQPGGRYVDCTVGAGGHAASILGRSQPGGQLLGLDADPTSIQYAKKRLESYGDSVLLVNDNFSNLESICYVHDFLPVHGILFDLGLASFQLDIEKRGFSFQQDTPLDMRFNASQEITAADIINTYNEAELADLLWTYGEEPASRRIAHFIMAERPVHTSAELAGIVERAVGGRHGKIHPATKTFQALRIVVNDELDNLESALSQAVKVLGFEGRLVVISYHSLEDRIVKQFMRREASDCICPPGTPSCVCDHKSTLKLITKKVIVPTRAEERANPRSRSAKMRVAERVLSEDEPVSLMERLCNSMEKSANAWRQPTLLKKIKRLFLTVGDMTD